MHQEYGMLKDLLDSERRWIYNEGIENTLFYASPRNQYPMAIFGVGAEIKHLVLDGKCLSIEVFHSDAQNIDDRELLLMFENCVGSIAGFHKYSVEVQGEATKICGTITFLSLEAAQRALEKKFKY